MRVEIGDRNDMQHLITEKNSQVWDLLILSGEQIQGTVTVLMK
jgi:hypothetical protein